MRRHKFHLNWTPHITRPPASSLTCQVEVGQDDPGQEALHVELDAVVLHILRDDGLDGAQRQHARLVDLPPAVHHNLV